MHVGQHVVRRVPTLQHVADGRAVDLWSPVPGQLIAALLQQAGQTLVYRVAGGGAVIVPTLPDGATGLGGATFVCPMAKPGWFVGCSVPAALGRLFVVFGVDSLDPPAGGLCVVVSEFCASAGAALKMAHATINVFITEVLSLFTGVKTCGTGRVSRASRQCHIH